MLPLGNFPCSFKKCRLLLLPPKLFCNVNWKQLLCSSSPSLMLSWPLLHILCKCLWKEKTSFISKCIWYRADFHPPSKGTGNLGDKLTKTTDHLPLTVCKKSPVVAGNLLPLCINLPATKILSIIYSTQLGILLHPEAHHFVQILQHNMNNSENVWKDRENSNVLRYFYLDWYVLADQRGNVCR